MGLWNVWMGVEPLTLRRTGCGAEGARLLASEDVEGELVGDRGVFMPVQQLAVKRLFPSRDGDKLRAQGIPPLRTCPHNGHRKSPAQLSAAPVTAAGLWRGPWCSRGSGGGGSALT